MANRIQLRRDTYANWTRVNPILADGEPALEIDTGKIKYGDGNTTYNTLTYSAIPNQLVEGDYTATLDAEGNLTIPGTIVASTAANIIVNGNTLTFDSNGNLSVPNNLLLNGVGIASITSPTNITLTAANKVVVNGALTVGRFTGTNAVTAANGDIIYNTTLGVFQGYAAGTWTSLGSYSSTTNIYTTATVDEPMDLVPIDGGSAGAVFEINKAFADGGTAANVFAPSDWVFDGNISSRYTLDGGAA